MRLQCRRPGSIPGLGRSPGERTGNPLQYSCLENTMDRGAWPARVHGAAKSQTQLRDFISPSIGPFEVYIQGTIFHTLGFFFSSESISQVHL